MFQKRSDAPYCKKAVVSFFCHDNKKKYRNKIIFSEPVLWFGIRILLMFRIRQDLDPDTHLICTDPDLNPDLDLSIIKQNK
jgi:hypothetical protein